MATGNMIVDGKDGPRISPGFNGVEIHLPSGKILIPMRDIRSVEIVDAEAVKKSDSAMLGAIGAVAGGPIGLLIGAGLGALTAEVHFLVETTNDKTYLFRSLKMNFNQFHKYYKIFKASQTTT